MKKTFLCLLLLVAGATSVPAQNLTFAENVKVARNTRPAAELWKNYVTEVVQGDPEEAFRKYWNPGEYDRGDLTAKVQSLNIKSFYQFVEHCLFRIRPIEDGFYEGTVLAETNLQEGRLIVGTYKFCAKLVGREFRLFNYFEVSKSRLCAYPTERIAYYYPPAYAFDSMQARSTADRFEGFCREYGVPEDFTVTYLVCENEQEGLEMLGLSMAMGNKWRDPGVILLPRFLLFTQANYMSRLVETVVRSYYPETSSLMQQGMAVYYSGNIKTYIERAWNQIKRFDGNLANFDDYPVVIGARSYMLHTIGALLVEKGLAEGGAEKVKRMLAYTNPKQMIEREFGVKPARMHDWLQQLLPDNYEQGS